MKVGLSIGCPQPTDGGGYTFIVELLRALARRQGAHGHDFVLCHENCAPVAAMFPQMAAIDLIARKAGVLSAAERAFEKLPPFVARGYRRLFNVPTPPSWEDRICIAEGIQFVFRLTPWSSGLSHVPYGTVSWDLQHRTSPWFPEVGQRATWTYREAYLAPLLQRASLICTGTHEGRREIETYYQVPTSRIKVLPMPVPAFALAAADAPADSSALHRLGVPADYIFYPAQFWAHKNHVVVLEACKRVRDRTGWNLGVVFTGADKETLSYVCDYAARLGLAPHCRLLSFVERPDLIALYKGAHALVFPTFFGPDNLPPLEAFALGCPVVASAVPGSQEQLGEAALRFAPTDEEALAGHVLALRDPATRAEMIARGHAHARAAPTWDDYAAGIVDSLDQFAKVRRAWP